MNAIEIIERVRAHDADLVVDEDRLLVRGRSGPLPEDLQKALREHRAELLVALGVPIDRTVSSILRALRQHLPAAHRRLSDDRLLVLVNWSIISAFEAAVREMSQGHQTPRLGGGRKQRC